MRACWGALVVFLIRALCEPEGVGERGEIEIGGRGDGMSHKVLFVVAVLVGSSATCAAGVILQPAGLKFRMYGISEVLVAVPERTSGGLSFLAIVTLGLVVRRFR